MSLGSSEQTIKLVFHHPVTFADSVFEFLAVEDLNMTAHVTDRSGILQAAGSHGDAFAANAQHIGDQLLSHDQFVCLKPVVT